MNTVSMGCISILAFGVLIFIGGLIGFKKAKSKASLIAGSVSAIALALCYWFSQSNPEQAFTITFILIGVLEGVFAMRLIKTKKFMPSGLMLIFCGLEQLSLFFALKHI